MVRELSPPLLLWLLLVLGAPWLALGAPLPRAVIHVGPHKTATLFIQVSRAPLRRRELGSAA